MESTEGEDIMRAVMFQGKKTMKLAEIEKPVTGKNGVVVKVKYCGICGSDIHRFIDGEDGLEGTVLGHETVGVVEEVGENVTGHKVGDRVAIGPAGACQEQCYYCRTGRPNLCLHGFPRTLGIGPKTQGGFSEYILAKYPARQLINIPDAVSMEDAVLFDIFATAYHGYRRSHMCSGSAAVVVGAGAIGLSMIQVLKAAGAGKIIALEMELGKQKIAKECGADFACSPLNEDLIVDKVKEMTDGRGADVAFECAGNPAAVGMAVRLVRPGAQVILVGSGKQPLESINEDEMILKELDMKGSFCYDEEEIRLVLQMMERGLFHTKGMISRYISLEQTPEAMEELAKTSAPIRYVIKPE